MRPNREWCAMTFISDRGYDVPHRGISSILNVTEAWELVYIIHTDKKPLEYRDC